MFWVEVLWIWSYTKPEPPYKNDVYKPNSFVYSSQSSLKSIGWQRRFKKSTKLKLCTSQGSWVECWLGFKSVRCLNQLFFKAQSHRISQVRRDPCGSSSPASWSLQDCLQLNHMTKSIIQASRIGSMSGRWALHSILPVPVAVPGSLLPAF